MENVYFITGYEAYESDLWEEKVYLDRADAQAEVDKRNLANLHGRTWHVETMRVIPKGGA